jgi:tRNA (cmo5U34)-methyltransferase
MKQFDNSTPHLATNYDSQILITIPYYECFRNETINIVKTIKNEPKIWLDVGAGTGTLVKRCMDLFPNTLFILADPSSEMLSEAKEKLSEYGEDRIQFLEPIQTQNMVWKSGLQPDVITAIQSHHYLSPEERKRATKVCSEVLKDGGIFVTFENTRPFTEKGIEISKQNWSNYQISRGKSQEQAEKHIERFGVEYFPITVEEHLNLYRECGFKLVELLWFSYMQSGFYCIK